MVDSEVIDLVVGLQIGLQAADSRVAIVDSVSVGLGYQVDSQMVDSEVVDMVVGLQVSLQVADSRVAIVDPGTIEKMAQ